MMYFKQLLIQPAEVIRLLSDKELPISKITDHFPMSRTAVVKHLHILSEANLVSGRKSGREKIYRLHPEPLEELQQWLSYYERFGIINYPC